MVVSVALSSRLEFKSSYVEMMPASTPEVRGVRDAASKVSSTTELTLAISGPPAARLAFAQRAVKALRVLPDVVCVDLERPAAFFFDRWLYLVPPAELEHLADGVERSVRRLRARANPLFVPLDDAPDPWGELREILAGWPDAHGLGRPSLDEGPAVLEVTPDGRYLLVSIRPRATMVTPIGEYPRLLGSIQRAIDEADPGRDGVEARLTGQMLVALEEYEVLSRDMKVATALSFVMVVLLMVVVTRRLGTLPVVGIPLAVGLAGTLAVTQLAVGHVNAVSGFMMPALVGLGVDFCVHLLLGYLERLDAGAAPLDAMRQAIAALTVPSLAAAATTALAFAALLVNTFDGLSEYGIIASLGVLVMLAATFLTLPPLALLLLRKPRPGRAARSPRPLNPALAWAMVGATCAFAAVAACWAPDVEFFNNFKALRGHMASSGFHEEIMEARGGPAEATLLMVGDLAEARVVEAEGRALAAAQTGDRDTDIARVLSVASLLPADAAAQRAQVARMRAALDRVPVRRLEVDDRRRVEVFRRWVEAEPWGVDDLPQGLRGRLMSNGGAPFVWIWPRRELAHDALFAVWTGHLDKIRRASAARGVDARVLDKSSIVTRMVTFIRGDFPLSFGLAVLAIVLVTVLTFRRAAPSGWVLGSLAVGLLGMLGIMGGMGLEFNLFNIVVLPSIVGIGIDNAVHVVHGHCVEGPGSVERVVATRGKAALLSSATTGLGFGAMIVAHHQGIRSLGVAAMIGMTCACLSSTVALPALLSLMDRRRARSRADGLRPGTRDSGR